MLSHKLEIEKREKSFKSRRIRIFLLFVFLELCFAFLIYRSFSLQCIQKSELQSKAVAQHLMRVSIGAKRGNIYDRNLQHLAIKVKSYSLYADPSNLKDWKSTAQLLSPILDMPGEEIIQKLRSGDYFVWLSRQLPDQVADRIKDLEIRGLGLEEEGKRFYPKGSLAAHVIGFVGLDNVGLDGIEKAYDRYIRGSIQEIKTRRDRKGRNLEPLEVGYDKVTYGYDVVLTIDEVIQNIAEEELKQACITWQSNGGSVIIMNPKTGEILALANYPTYDLNQAFFSSDDHKRNRAIRDLYEPGSVFKIITAAAAINENLYKTNEQIDCENGVYTLNGHTIHDVHSYNLLTFSEVVEKSSNIGITKIASRLGIERLRNYIQAFGIDEKTGVDLPESFGFVRPLEQWTGYSMASIPYGQELAVTAIQILCEMNAIANGGVMMKPFIVRDLRTETRDLRQDIQVSGLGSQVSSLKSTIEFSPGQSRKPISNATARIMTEILVKAVENGTGKNAMVNGYRVAGKTGTAQKASGNNKGYLPGKYISSFTGFLPAENPVISMIVVIDEPRGTHTAGTVACPVFSQIASQVMQYLSVGQRFYFAGIRPSS